jgi:hypothetical protein
MSGDGVTNIVIAVILAVAGLDRIVAGARGLVTGRMTPRLTRWTLGRLGVKDQTSTALCELFYGFGALALGAGRLTHPNVLVLVAVAMVVFGTVLGLLLIGMCVARLPALTRRPHSR